MKEQYILDLNKIFEFVYENSHERTHDTEITEMYGIEENLVEETEDGIIIKHDTNAPLTLQNRTIREVKGNSEDRPTLRYDMVKTFISILDNSITEPNEMDIMQRLVFNTMLSYGMIKVVPTA